MTFFNKNHITVWYCCISCWLQSAWYPVSVMFHSGHYQCKSVWEHCGYLYELMVKHYSAFTSPLSGGFDCFYRLAGLCVDFHTTISYVLWVSGAVHIERVFVFKKYNNYSSSLKQPNMALPPLLSVSGGRVYINVRVCDVTNPGSSSL